jgi:hypothetical protein
MGLSWQQGPLAPGAIGRFLVPVPLPERLLYIEPLRRRMRVRFGGDWIADSENVLLFFEPGRYPVAYFPQADVSPEVLEHSEHVTKHPDLGQASWYLVKAGDQRGQRITSLIVPSVIPSFLVIFPHTWREERLSPTAYPESSYTGC